jgi:hypothetical protein
MFSWPPATTISASPRHLLGQAGLQQGLARRVLARTRRQHLAHDHLTDLRRVDVGARQRFLDHDRAQLGGRDLGQRAAELADGGADGRNDDDVFHAVLLMR